MGVVMTMLSERARALRLAGETLRKRRAKDDVTEDLRDQARLALRHYLDSDELKQIISDIDSLPHELLDQRWLAPEAPAHRHATGAV